MCIQRANPPSQATDNSFTCIEVGDMHGFFIIKIGWEAIYILFNGFGPCSQEITTTWMVVSQGKHRRPIISFTARNHSPDTHKQHSSLKRHFPLLLYLHISRLKSTWFVDIVGLGTSDGSGCLIVAIDSSQRFYRPALCFKLRRIITATPQPHCSIPFGVSTAALQISVPRLLLNPTIGKLGEAEREGGGNWHFQVVP
jgi:hypothetical protein